MAKTGVWNWHFVGWNRDGWIVDLTRKRSSQKEFTCGKQVDFR